MKNLLLSLITLIAFVGCETTTSDVQKEPETPPTPPAEEPAIVVDIDESRLTEYQVIYSIRPKDKEAFYYCDVMSKTRFETADINTVKAEFDTALRNYAEMTGDTYEAVCEQMLFKGDTEEFVSDAGYRADTDFVIYTFYWTEGELNTEDIYITEFRTPSHRLSSESVAITFESVDPYEMTVKCVPTANVERYYYYFAETAKVEAMLAELEDENAYMSYHAMNVGTQKSGEQTLPQKGLKPETSYTALVMAVDKSGYRMQTSAVQTTPAVSQNSRIESELFETLLGEWSGVQTIYDGYAEPAENQFTVNIVAGVEDYDYNYRDNNQLLALVDGWCNVAYYSVTNLIEYEIEDPELKWGPKWILDIAEGDVITIDGQAHHPVVGWQFFGNSFILSANSSTGEFALDTTLNVTLSEDGNTLTISSPLEGYYPSLGYNFQDIAWMAQGFGLTDIVLTRK
ncbi:MAG: hypothetical protein J6U93_02695 [Alistipes sp.]|nr:hypothetical protein [Alistipes sp.]